MKRWGFWTDVALAALMVANLVLACLDGDVGRILAWFCALTVAVGNVFRGLTIELLRDEVKRTHAARWTGARS